MTDRCRPLPQGNPITTLKSLLPLKMDNIREINPTEYQRNLILIEALNESHPLPDMTGAMR